MAHGHTSPVIRAGSTVAVGISRQVLASITSENSPIASTIDALAGITVALAWSKIASVDVILHGSQSIVSLPTPPQVDVAV